MIGSKEESIGINWYLMHWIRLYPNTEKVEQSRATSEDVNVSRAKMDNMGRLSSLFIPMEWLSSDPRRLRRFEINIPKVDP
jgi:hypothetical protein